MPLRSRYLADRRRWGRALRIPARPPPPNRRLSPSFPADPSPPPCPPISANRRRHRRSTATERRLARICRRCGLPERRGALTGTIGRRDSARGSVAHRPGRARRGAGAGPHDSEDRRGRRRRGGTRRRRCRPRHPGEPTPLERNDGPAPEAVRRRSAGRAAPDRSRRRRRRPTTSIRRGCRPTPGRPTPPTTTTPAWPTPVLSLQRLAVHRAELSLPEGAARLAFGEAGV